MKEPGEEELFSKLCDLVGKDQRLENIAVACQPGLFTLHIGVQDPFWRFPVDKSRLVPGELPAYAMKIVDEWEAQLKR